MDGMEQTSSSLAADLLEFRTNYPDIPLPIKFLKDAAKAAIYFSIQPLLDLDSFRKELVVLRRLAELMEQDNPLVCIFASIVRTNQIYCSVIIFNRRTQKTFLMRLRPCSNL